MDSYIFTVQTGDLALEELGKYPNQKQIDIRDIKSLQKFCELDVPTSFSTKQGEPITNNIEYVRIELSSGDSFAVSPADGEILSAAWNELKNNNIIKPSSEALNFAP